MTDIQAFNQDIRRSGASGLVKGARWMAAATAVGIGFGASQSAMAADGTWVIDDSGDWNTSDITPWQGGTIAQGANSTAFFDTDITATRTVTLTEPLTIGNLLFEDDDPSSAASWIIGNGDDDANILTLSGDSPTITVQSLGGSSITRIDAVIAGSNGLTKGGAGVLALNNANTYSGGTTVSEGALRVQDSQALGSGDVTVADGAQLQLRNDIDIANAISISGHGLSSTVGHNTVSGLVTLDDDARISGVNASQTSLTVNDVDLGSHTLIVATGAANTGHVVIDGTITGSGNITKINVGNLTISSDNSATYSGTTEFRRGVLLLGNDGALGAGSVLWKVDNDQAATIRSSSAATRTIANNLTITAQSTGNPNARHVFGGDDSGDLIFTGDIAITGTRRFQVFNDTTRFDGEVSGGGFNKEGAGTLILNGTNTYTGSTTVKVGTLLVNGANNGGGAVTVEANATLGGTGSIAGNVGFEADSIFLALIDGALDIGGQVTIDSGALIATDDVLTLSSYTVLTHGIGALTGLFTIDDSIINQNYQVVYNDDSVTLELIPEPATLALLGLGGVLMMGRRRKAAPTA